MLDEQTPWSTEISLEFSQYRALQGCGHFQEKSPLVTSSQRQHFVTSPILTLQQGADEPIQIGRFDHCKFHR